MAVDIIARGLAGAAGEQAEIAQRLVAEEYDPTHQYYNTNDIVTYEGKLYICTSTNVTGTFDPTKWQQIVVSSELTEIVNKLATITNPMLIKGRVDEVSDLPVDAEPGWVYFVGAEGSTDFEEYVYTENDGWQYIGVTQTVDTELSPTSTNPVQNRVITAALDGKANQIELAPAYSSSHTYVDGELFTYGGKFYKVDSVNGSRLVGLTNLFDPTAAKTGALYVDNAIISNGDGNIDSLNDWYVSSEVCVNPGNPELVKTLAVSIGTTPHDIYGNYGPWMVISSSGEVYQNHSVKYSEINGSNYISVDIPIHYGLRFSVRKGLEDQIQVREYVGTVRVVEVDVDSLLVGRKTSAGGEIFNVTSNNQNTASAVNTHAEGNSTTASGTAAHAEGAYGVASGDYSHAEGYSSHATGTASHAEGGSVASGMYAHGEGWQSTASGDYSHAQNYFTTAASDYQTVIGKYNVVDDQDVYALIVGNGTYGIGGNRGNALTVDWSGNVVGGTYNGMTVAADHIVINGIPLYISSTTPTGTIPEGSLGIGF